MGTDDNTLVHLVDVHKKFLHEGREVVILKGIDLLIERGEMLSVVGPSGAGKSTLLHIMGTLDLPTSGKIEYEGRDVTRLSPARLADFRNRSLGFVFQAHHLLPEFTALENVMMPGLIGGHARGKLERTAKDLLHEVGLSPRLSHRPGELSGGEQARVALARALVLDPMLVLADEPTGNLDSKTSDSVHRLFFELNKARGTTFLIVTHNEALADSMPRKVSLRDGKVELDLRRDSEGGPFRRADAGDPSSLSIDTEDEDEEPDEEDVSDEGEVEESDDEGREHESDEETDDEESLAADA